MSELVGEPERRGAAFEGPRRIPRSQSAQLAYFELWTKILERRGASYMYFDQAAAIRE